jgi:outer membrane autotransporter protein
MARRRECLLAKPSRAPKDLRVSLSKHRIAWLMGSTALILAAATVPATAQTALPNSNLPLLLQNFPGGNPFTVSPGVVISTGAAGIAIQGNNSSNWTLNNQGTVSSDTTAMQFDAAATIVNSGTIAGGNGPAINFGNFNNSVTNTGNITSNGATAILFGAGNDTLIMNGGTINKTVVMGDGVDTFTMTAGTIQQLDQGGNLDTATISGGRIIGAFNDGDFFTMTGGRVGSVDLRVANNVMRMSGGTIDGIVNAEQGNDQLFLSGGSIGGQLDFGNGNNTLTVTGGSIGGGIVTGNGIDNLVWNGGGTIATTINLGNGNDAATLGNLTSGILAPTTLIDGGAGTDRLTFDNTEASGVARFQNWENVNLTNTTRLTLDGNMTLGDAGTLTGTLAIDPTSTLYAGAGVNAAVQPFNAAQFVTVTNAGAIDLTNGPASTTDRFTVSGNYVGQGGRVVLNTVLASDGAPSDRLVINRGGATGNSFLTIQNLGGPGALTTGNGILVVDTTNAGTTAPGAFALASGYVAAGPYAYTLHRSSVDATNPQAWYLRSTLDCASNSGDPACASGAAQAADYRPETSLYAAIPSMALLYGRSLLDTLHERAGDDTASANPRSNFGWGRVIAQHGNHDGDPLGVYGNGPRFNYTIGAIQAGSDLIRKNTNDGGRLSAGFYGAAGMTLGDVTHADRTDAGRNRLNGYSIGGYATYFGPSGWYLDAVAQTTWYDISGISNVVPTLKTNGWGFAGSLETGVPVYRAGGITIEPQAQIVYQHIDLADGTDTAAIVKFSDVESLAGRLGVRFARTWALDDSPTPRTVTAWLRPNFWYEFYGDPKTSFTSATGLIPFLSNFGGSSVEINAGMSAQIASATSLYANVSYQTGIDGDNNGDVYSGKIGLKVAW